MNTVVNMIFATVPSRKVAAGDKVLLADDGLMTAELGVDAGGKPGNTAADD